MFARHVAAFVIVASGGCQLDSSLPTDAAAVDAPTIDADVDGAIAADGATADAPMADAPIADALVLDGPVFDGPLPDALGPCGYVHSNTSTGGDADCFDCASGEADTESVAEISTVRYHTTGQSLRLYALGDNRDICTDDYKTCWNSIATFPGIISQPSYVTFWMNADVIPWNNRYVGSLKLVACDSVDCTKTVVVSEACDVSGCGGTALMVDCEATETGDDGRSWCRQTIAWPAARNVSPFYFALEAHGHRWDNSGQDSWIEVFVDDLCTSDAGGTCDGAVCAF